MRSRVIREFLVKWKDLLIEGATWEGGQVLHHPNMKLLEDKQSWVGRIVMSPLNEVAYLLFLLAYSVSIGSSGKNTRELSMHKQLLF